MSPRVKPLYLGGTWLSESAINATFPVVNPATQQVIAEVPCGGAAETQLAVDIAVEAQTAWADVAANERARLLRRSADLMLARQDEIARTITLEEGKPLAEAAGEVEYASSFFAWFAEEARRIQGQVLPAPVADKRILVIHRPVGVTAAITPWNFPAAMITRKLGAALAAGCAMVVKPSELTPLTALLIAEVLDEAELPSGLVSIVTGPDPALIGDTLLADDRVRKISFTGSTNVGKMLMARGSHNLTRLSLELGGHAPFIVFDDADLDLAADQAMASKMRNMGQTCVCANRFYVHNKVIEPFTEAIVTRVKQLKVGDGFDPDVNMGPLINDRAIAKVRRHVDDAVDRGARVVYSGDPVPPSSTYCAPVVMADVDETMLVTQEETFGPVLPLMSFETEDEVVERANSTEYGLAAYFFTRDIGRVMRLAERLQYGVLGANDGMPSTAQAPFGGMKASGFGREGGHLGIYEYLDSKYVSLGQINR